jgi:hypothetical protein
LEIRGKLIKKGGKYLTLSQEKYNSSNPEALLLPKSESIGGFPLKGGKKSHPSVYIGAQ